MRAFLLSAGALMFLVPATAMAKPAFLGSVPNSAALSCDTCHVPGSPKSVRNDFGIDVKANLKGGMPDWQAVCDIDSDGDGATNGEELQDTLCEWVAGPSGCSALVTAPGNPASVPSNAFCGDGTCDEGEDAGCCAVDCMCGNDVCDDNEDFESCPADCDEPPPPPVDEEETDAGPTPDVPEADVAPEEDAAGPEDVPVSEDVPVPEDVPEPEEDAGAGDDATPSEDAGAQPADVPPAGDTAGSGDAGTTPADAGTQVVHKPGEKGDDGGCAVAQSTPPIWMGLLVLFFMPLFLRRRED